MSENQLTKQEEAIVDGFSPETVERIMTPKNDIIFKKLFGTVGREKMVKDFLEAILNIKIKSVELGKETILLPVDTKIGKEFKPGVYVLDKGSRVNEKTTTNMIQKINPIFAVNPLISKEI